VDRDLVVRARNGDHDAFARLVVASIGRLNAIARLIVSDYAIAEDAVQDALVDAWRNLRGLRDPDRFDPWLNRVLVRSCQNARRRETRRRGVELILPALSEPAQEDVQGSLARTDQLEHALSRLTVDQRAVLVLAYFLDLPLAEAAATLGIPTGTMKSRLARALAALRASIDADERLTIQPAERTA
jgi:RNA polymerase sigma-70 factor (ECF subfamily)